MRIPLSRPEITDNDIQAVVRVLATPRLSRGPELERFEAAMKEFVGTAHAVAVNSGTSALHLCIRALEITRGDEVIVPSFSFIAVANAVVYEGATPVFADIGQDSFNLDPCKVEAAISPRTRAIIVVHTFGQPAPMGEILAIARRHGLTVIEDSSEALGSEYCGRKAGAWADMGVYAFYPNKQITTGEGGMAVMNDAKTAARFRMLRNQGRDGSGDWFDHSQLGFSYRMAELNCALGREQLKRIESTIARRQQVVRLYNEELRQVPSLLLPAHDLPDRRTSWFAYVVRLERHFGRAHRDWIRGRMMAKGIECGRYFAPIHLQPFYQTGNGRRADLPVTEAVADRCLALPFFNTLTASEISEVSETLTGLMEESLNLEAPRQAGDGFATTDHEGNVYAR